MSKCIIVDHIAEDTRVFAVIQDTLNEKTIQYIKALIAKEVISWRIGYDEDDIVYSYHNEDKSDFTICATLQDDDVFIVYEREMLTVV